MTTATTDVSVTVTDGRMTLTFAVAPYVRRGDRLYWCYTVSDVSDVSASAVLATGCDLSAPDFGTAWPQVWRMLETLLSFATAAAESYAYGGTEFCGFPLAAVEAFHQLSDEIVMAGFDLESELAETGV